MKETKEKIYQALLKHVAKKGIANISTVQLAKEVGISESVIFYYYKDVKTLIEDSAMRYDRELMNFSIQSINEGLNMSQLWDTLMDYALNNSDGANFYFDYVNYYGFNPTESNTRADKFYDIAKSIFKEKKDLDKHTTLILWDFITTQLFYYCNKMTSGYMEPNEENKKIIKKIVFCVYDNL